MKDNLRGTIVGLGIFLTVCALAAFLLVSVFAQLRFGAGNTYYAEFTNVSNLRKGKLVRIAGVEVGKVKAISINPDATVRVEFTADKSVIITEGTRAVLRYDNLFGDRYLALEEGAGGVKTVRSRTNHSAGPHSTRAGSGCADRWLPTAVSCAEPGAGQRAERTVDTGLSRDRDPRSAHFWTRRAAVTNTLADRDLLIGQVVGNLNVVLGSLGDQSDRLDKAVTSLSQLIHGLAERKTDISNAVAYTNAAAGSVADLLSQARAPFRKVVQETDRTAGIALADHDYLDNLSIRCRTSTG